MDFEGAHGVLVERGGEDYSGVGVDEFEDVEAGELRHLHVQENQRGLMGGYRFHGFEAIGAFGEDLNFGVHGEKFADGVTSELFVVDDDSAELGLWCAHRAASSCRVSAIGTDTISKGRESCTLKIPASIATRISASLP